MDAGDHLTPEKAADMAKEKDEYAQGKKECLFCGEPQGNLPVHMRHCDERENSEYAEESGKYGADVPTPDE